MGTTKSKKPASIWEVVITNVITAIVTIVVAVLNSNGHYNDESAANKELAKKIEQLTISVNQINTQTSTTGNNQTEQHNIRGTNVGRDVHGNVNNK